MRTHSDFPSMCRANETPVCPQHWDRCAKEEVVFEYVSMCVQECVLRIRKAKVKEQQSVIQSVALCIAEMGNSLYCVCVCVDGEHACCLQCTDHGLSRCVQNVGECVQAMCFQSWEL